MKSIEKGKDSIKERKKFCLGNKLKTQLSLQSMVVPGIIYAFIFSYIPLFGIIIAFKDYDIVTGIFNSPWVGFKYFKEFLTSPNFGMVMKNTLLISTLKLVVGFPFPIIFALMLNEIKCMGSRKVFQTITYLPHFMSWVIVSGMIMSLLSVDGGQVNEALMKLGVIKEPVNWISTPKYFLPILIGSGIWKEFGFCAIIYIAAISGVNPELYEACSIDGASRLRQMLVVTLPAIIPQIAITLIMKLASILNAGFDDILLLTNEGQNTIMRNVSDVIETYVYRMGLRSARYSYATAVGLFKSVVSITMLVLSNKLSAKLTDTTLW